MRSARPLFVIAACLCLAAVLTSCGSRAKGGARPAAASQETPGASNAAKAAAKSNVASPEPSGNYYVVDFGDTLGTIAERFGVSEDTLLRLNQIPDANKINVGQRLRLPAGAVEATAVAGPTDSVKVPILLYHHLALLSAGAGQEWYVTTVTPQAFEEQIAYLAYNGYRSVKVSDLVEALEGRKTLPAKPVVITFDDGWTDGYDIALPILQKYGMIASFFITASWMDGGVSQTMNWAQIEALSGWGMEIGSHSMTHPYLNQLDAEQLAWELQNSKALLEEHIKEPVQVLAYPFGVYDYNVMAQAGAAGYRAALTIEDGVFVTSDKLLQMPRLTVLYGATLDEFAAMLRP